MPVGVRPLSVNTFSLSSLQETHRQTNRSGNFVEPVWRLKQKLDTAATRSLPSQVHVHAHKHRGYLSTENILAIFPIARILFLITSLRAAAALAGKKRTVIPVAAVPIKFTVCWVFKRHKTL